MPSKPKSILQLQKEIKDIEGTKKKQKEEEKRKELEERLKSLKKVRPREKIRRGLGKGASVLDRASKAFWG